MINKISNEGTVRASKCLGDILPQSTVHRRNRTSPVNGEVVNHIQQPDNPESEE